MTTEIEASGLSGWKAIARYLGVSMSCARTWARIHGLPVMYRPDGRTYITKSLVDQWVMARAQLRHEALKAAKAERDRIKALPENQ